jgi:hypothetical protein
VTVIENELRLVVSGTCSTGKSTIAEILSIATGIPLTHAMTSREFLRDLFPGNQLEELSADELARLGLRRLEERINHEDALSRSFIADGSVINDWIGCVARMQIGISPGDALPAKLLKGVGGLSRRRLHNQYMEAYGTVVNAYAKRSCDGHIHLPVEFPLSPERSRPIYEEYRRLADELLVQTLNELKIPYLVVGGTVRERVDKVIDLFGLPLKMSLDEAIEAGKGRVRKARETKSRNGRTCTARKSHSRLRRIRYAQR